MLQFTAFDVSYQSNCPWDHLTIRDGDGTPLMNKTCGSCPAGSLRACNFLPSAIKSRSNVVNLLFISNGDGAKTGWSVSWIAVTPGEYQQCSTTRILKANISHSCSQSAALPPTAAPAPTWKPTTANMNFWLPSAAAAASARFGSTLLVFSIQQLEPDSGSR